MSESHCAFCSTVSKYEEMWNLGNGDCLDMPCYDCPNCGRYVLGQRLNLDLKRHQGDDAFKIACLVRERRVSQGRNLYGVLEDNFQPSDQDVITTNLKPWWRISELLAEFPKPTEIFDRALLNLSRFAKHPMDEIEPDGNDLPYILFCPKRNISTQLNYMKEMGLIHQGSNSTRGQARFAISPKGWSRIQELSRIGRESTQAFVAMWFDPQTDDIYEKGIRLAIEKAGYVCKQMKYIEHNNKICDEIVAQIRKSRFVIADFTAGRCVQCEKCEHADKCKDKVRPRGGVYFEAGFAMGLGLPVIWLVRQDQVDDLHFDTRQYNHIVYESAQDLEKKLLNRIAATIH